MTKEMEIDTEEKAFKTGCVIEKIVSDEKLANTIFERLSTAALKWAFIRGFYNTNGLITSNTLWIRSHLHDLLGSVAEFSSLPYTLEMDCLRYHDTNMIDFLGVIYGDEGTTAKMDQDLHSKYLKLLTLDGSQLPGCLVYRSHPDAILPTKTRTSDVGYDLSVIRKVKDLNAVVALYDTGIKIRAPHGYYAEVIPRSSLSKSGYMLANSVGIIDRSYNGNIYVALARIDENSGPVRFPFRCCQLIFRRQYHVSIQEIGEDLEATARGEGGFGSTG